MIFANPTMLWAAFGIVVPLAIHLWSRQKRVVIKVGSIKLLRKSEPSHSSTIRINEWWLLFLRMLTILLLALALAGPKYDSSVDRVPITYLVEASLLGSEKIQGILDTIPFKAKRVLVEDFPKIGDYDRDESDQKPPKYWQLLQNLSSLPSDSLIVFTKALVSGVRGMRPRTNKPIHFIRIDDENTSEHVLSASRKQDSIELLTMLGDEKTLRFKTATFSLDNSKIEVDKNADSVTISGRRLPVQNSHPLQILIVHSDGFEREMKYFGAAYRAISINLERNISVNYVTQADTIALKNYDFSIWLGAVPSKEVGRPHLQFRPNALASELIVAGERSHTYYLTERLNSENVVTEYVAETLMSLLPIHQDLAGKISSYDRRQMAITEFRPNAEKQLQISKTIKLMDISLWVWGVLLFVVMAERILSKFRGQ